MSVRLTPTSYAYRSTGLPTSDPLTVCFYGYLAVDTNAYAAFWSLGGASVNQLIGVDSDGTTLIFYGAVPGIVTGPALTVGQWYHIAYVRNGTSNTVYLDGVSAITNTSSPGSSNTTMAVGVDSGASFPLNGRVCALKVWNAALTQAEIQTERYQLAPVRTLNLNNFWPLLSTSEMIDAVDGGTLTSAGTITTEENPPIAWRGRRRKTAFVTASTTIWTGQAALIGVGSLIAAPKRVQKGVVSLTGLGSQVVTGTRIQKAVAALTGLGSLASTGLRIARGQVALTGSGTLAATPKLIAKGQVVLTGLGTMIVSVSGTIITGAAQLTGHGDLLTQGIRIQLGRATLTGLGVLTALSTRVTTGIAVLTGRGSLFVRPVGALKRKLVNYFWDSDPHQYYPRDKIG